jgi:hypothetical protein
MSADGRSVGRNLVRLVRIEQKVHVSQFSY